MVNIVLVIDASGNEVELLHGLEADKLRGWSILITGGAGFLGSWLAEGLLSLGADVAVLDGFSTGNLGNVQHLHYLN